MVDIFRRAVASAALSRPRPRVLVGYPGDDLSFQGPLEQFDDADAFITSLRGLFQIVKGAEEQKIFVDSEDVCVIYDLVTVPAGTFVQVIAGEV